MQITWEADNDEFRGRKRVRRACSRCKKLKKRCKHTFEAFDADEEGSLYSPPGKRREYLRANGVVVRHGPSPLAVSSNQPTRSTSGPSNSPTQESCNGIAIAASRGEERRFLGDMNPEAALIEEQGLICKDKSRTAVGIFHHRTAETPSSEDEAAAKENEGDDDLHMHVRVHLHDYLTAIGAFDMPIRSTQEGLVAFYFSQVHPILPLLDKASYLQSFRDGTASQLLTQAICLVAAKEDRGLTDLRFDAVSPSLSSRAFCTKLHMSLAASVNAGFESNHITLARILALMSFHVEGYQGADASSMYLAQAIHHSQSVGLQIAPPDHDHDREAKQDLFWCLWSLDKLHSSMDGRPILIADRDISVPRPESGQKCKTAFEVWLKISDLLAAVIDFYRPTAPLNTTGWEDNFPSFEDVIGEEIGSDLKPEILGVLELYYHFVAIGSRRSRPLEKPTTSTASSVRQSLSALRIQALLTDEFPSGLPPLPIVPGSLSFAMTVAYRQLRQSKIVTHFNRAKANLEATCTLLERMGKMWWTARGLARLGRRALRKVEKMQVAGNSKSMQRSGRRLPEQPNGITSTQDSLPLSDNVTNPDSAAHPPPSNQSYSPLVDSQTFLSPFSGSISQDSSAGNLSNDPWYGQATFGAAFDDFDALLAGYVDLGFPTNIWNSDLIGDGTSSSLELGSTGGGSVGT